MRKHILSSTEYFKSIDCTCGKCGSPAKITPIGCLCPVCTFGHKVGEVIWPREVRENE